MVIGRFWLVLILLVFVGEGSSFAQEIATRPVKTIVILPAPESVSRRYPAVLEPKEVVELSFEVGGRSALLASKLDRVFPRVTFWFRWTKTLCNMRSSGQQRR
jgi:multidrug efflux pump subunit AcrA (membrane-fusion protein)